MNNFNEITDGREWDNAYYLSTSLKKTDYNMPSKFDILDRMVRQGDVLLYPIDEIPADAIKSDITTLAYGEKSGHEHKVRGQVLVYNTMQPKTLRTLDMKEVTADKFVQVLESTVTNPASLVHENSKGQKADHDARNLKVGNYMVIQEEEYSPFEDQIHRVED